MATQYTSKEMTPMSFLNILYAELFTNGDLTVFEDLIHTPREKMIAHIQRTYAHFDDGADALQLPTISLTEQMVALQKALYQLDLKKPFNFQEVVYQFTRAIYTLLRRKGDENNPERRMFLHSSLAFAMGIQKQELAEIHTGNFPPSATCNRIVLNMRSTMDDIITYYFCPIISPNNTLGDMQQTISQYIQDNLISPTYISLQLPEGILQAENVVLLNKA